MIRTAALALLISTAAFAQSAPPAEHTPAPLADDLPDTPSTSAHLVSSEPTGPYAIFDTTLGRITCQLYDKEVPLASANFIGLATGTKEYTNPVTGKKVNGVPFYNGTTFHRVIPHFMIQGGDPLGDGTGGPGYEFANEPTNLHFDRAGRLAMANSGPDTNGSQFFITSTPYESLDGNYSLFGQCDQPGIEVVSTITHVNRDSNDKPVAPVILNKVTIVPVGQPIPPEPPVAAPLAR